MNKVLNFFREHAWLRYFSYLILLSISYIFRDYTPSNELKYISIVDEALSNNTWFAFFNQGYIYADKPPLFFWLMMVSKLILGDHCFLVYGLFALLPAAGVMMVMDKWMRLECKDTDPLLSNVLLGTTMMFIGSALVIRMDMLMTMFIVLSLYTFFKMYKGVDKPRDKYLLPLYIFLALFSKGPMGLIIPILSIIAFLIYKRSFKSIGKYLGWKQWLILVTLCLGWFAMVYVEGGSEYLNNLLFKQTVGRGINSFHHKEPLYYYIPRFFYAFAPWSIFYIVVVIKSLHKKLIKTDTERFFLVIFVVNFIMLSVVSSKLDIYMLPLYPFLAYLAAIALPRFGSRLGNSSQKDGLIKWSLLIPAIVLALPLIVLIIEKTIYPVAELDIIHLSISVWIGVVLLFAGSAWGVVCIIKNRYDSGIISTAAGLLLLVFTASFGLEDFNRYIGYGEVAGDAMEYAREAGIEDYAYYEYHKFSNMDTYLGKRMEYIESLELLKSMDDRSEPIIIFVRGRELERREGVREWLSEKTLGGESNDVYWYIID